MNPLLGDMEERRRQILEEQVGAEAADPANPANNPYPQAPVSVAPPTPAPVTVEPQAYPAELQDAALKAALDKHAGDVRRGQYVNIGRNAARVVGAPETQYTPPPAVDVEAIQTRRQGLDQEFKAGLARSSASAMSPEARLKQELARRSGLAGGMEDLLGQSPASALPSMEDYLKLQAAKLKAAKTGGTPSDPTSWNALIDANAEIEGLPATVVENLKKFAAGADDKSRRAALAGNAEKGLGRQNSAQVASDNRVATNNRFGITHDTHVDDQVEAGVKHISDKIGNQAASFKAASKELSSAIKSFPGDLSELPGVGLLETKLSDHPAYRAWLASNDGLRVKGLVKQMGDQYMRFVSGAQINDTEKVELLQSGVEALNGPSMLEGLRRLETLYNSAIQKASAGARPESFERFRKRAPGLFENQWGSSVAPTPASPGGADAGTSAPSSAAGVDTSTPIREPGGAVAPIPGGGQFKLQRNKITGKTRRVYPDGRVEEVP